MLSHFVTFLATLTALSSIVRSQTQELTSSLLPITLTCLFQAESTPLRSHHGFTDLTPLVKRDATKITCGLYASADAGDWEIVKAELINKDSAVIAPKSCNRMGAMIPRKDFSLQPRCYTMLIVDQWCLHLQRSGP